MQDGKPVILYVDDDQDFLDGTRFLLEANGYVMLEALSAEDGLKIYRQHEPDLVLVDLMMEEVDAGTALVKELRALGSSVPVIMISSAGDNLSLVTDYGDLGLSGVFQKPVDPDTLLMILSQRIPRTKDSKNA
ncbi:MAG: response regulator [Planctomycetota bacterium]|nr:response regulator [Planctomycetota bacterium]